jgi:hypothetical protein
VPILKLDHDIEFLLNFFSRTPVFQHNEYFRILTWNFTYIKASNRLACKNNSKLLDKVLSIYESFKMSMLYIITKEKRLYSKNCYLGETLSNMFYQLIYDSIGLAEKSPSGPIWLLMRPFLHSLCWITKVLLGKFYKNSIARCNLNTGTNPLQVVLV